MKFKQKVFQNNFGSLLIQESHQIRLLLFGFDFQIHPKQMKITLKCDIEITSNSHPNSHRNHIKTRFEFWALPGQNNTTRSHSASPLKDPHRAWKKGKVHSIANLGKAHTPNTPDLKDKVLFCCLQKGRRKLIWQAVEKRTRQAPFKCGDRHLAGKMCVAGCSAELCRNILLEYLC